MALLPWGDQFEDYLDDIGVTLEEFATDVTGGWLFGYVEALQCRGIESVIFCMSARAANVQHHRHRPTGARIVVLPSPGPYRWFRRRMRDPYAWSREGMFGPAPAARRLAQACVRPLVPYLATPPVMLAAWMRRTGCNAILCQEYESPRFDLAVAIGRISRIPTFATFQGGDWHASWLEGLIRPVSLRAARGLIVGPSSEAERVQRRYGVPDEMLARIFNPLDASQWTGGSGAAMRRKLGVPESVRVAVWHGRVDWERKGLDVLLDAWDLVCRQERAEEFFLLLVGTGRDADLLDSALSAHPARTRIHWVREYVLDRRVVRDYLAAGDVYVLPSRHEGFAVAPLEAMASGLPVVASAVPGIADVFEHGRHSGGLTVPLNDAPALAHALSELLTDSDRCRLMGQRARRRVEEAFSIETVGLQLDTFLRARGAFR